MSSEGRRVTDAGGDIHFKSILIKLGHNGRREKERISYGKELASLSSQYNSEGRNFLIGWDPIVFDLHK